MIYKNEDIRIVRTKKALKKAFSALLAEIPYEKISIIDICERAQVHRATFYNYYRSKDDLFVACIKNSNDYLIGLFKDKNNEIKTRSEVINHFVDSFIEQGHQTLPYVKKVVAVQTKEKMAKIIGRSLYECLYQILSLFPSQNQCIPKDFIAQFYAGAMTSICFWSVENNVSKEEFERYVHYYLKDREKDDFN